MSINSLLTNLPVLEAVKAYVGGGGGGSGTVTSVAAAAGAGAGLLVTGTSTVAPIIGLNCAAAGTTGQVLSQTATPGVLDWISILPTLESITNIALTSANADATNPLGTLSAEICKQFTSGFFATSTIGFFASIVPGQFQFTVVNPSVAFAFSSSGSLFPPAVVGDLHITFATSPCFNQNTGIAGFAKFNINNAGNLLIDIIVGAEAATDDIIIVGLPTMFTVNA